MSEVFCRQRCISLRATDAAGVLFFAEQLALVHDVYEELLEELGAPLRSILEGKVYGLPIVKAETELLAPLRVGDRVDISLKVERTSSSAFTLGHELMRGTKRVGAGRTVHVCIDAASGRARPLPPELASRLQSRVDKH